MRDSVTDEMMGQRRVGQLGREEADFCARLVFDAESALRAWPIKSVRKRRRTRAHSGSIRDKDGRLVEKLLGKRSSSLVQACQLHHMAKGGREKGMRLQNEADKWVGRWGLSIGTQVSTG
jgi:hypothetical protein